MNRIPLILSIIGVFLIVLMPIWTLVVIPELTKMPSTFHHYEEQTGIDSMAPYVAADLPKSFEHHDIQEIKVVNTVGNNLKILSTLQAANVKTGEIFLDDSRLFDVDSYSRSNTSVEKGYFWFPPNVQRQDYFLTFPLAFSHSIFSFKGSDIVEGLETYVFSCQTKPYDITKAISKFKDLPAESFYSCNIWVEPVTGRHVNFELQWETYATKGQDSFLIEKGNKMTDPKYVSLLVDEAKKEKGIFQIYQSVIPTGLLISGGLILLFSRTSIISKKIELDNAELTQNIEELESLMKKTTNEIFRSSKLINIGQLALNLSHDIRSALAVIATTSIILQNRKMGSLTEKDKADFDRIRNSVDKISNQLNDMLDFIKISPLTLSEYSINEIIASVLERLSFPKDVKIIIPENDIKITCDRIKMESVIMNLISNSIDAVGDNGTISLSAQNLNDHTIIRITDSGQGIPDTAIKKIFDPLFTTKPHGTGLGLAISKNIIAQHNGSIELQNNPTTFTISLPLLS